MIPYGRQEITDADVQAVVDVLRSDFLTQGPAVPRFERLAADAVGARHAIAVNSATSALHIACLALDLQPGDRLWTSPITFVASANCGLYCGARIDFVDIDPKTYNLCPVALETKLTEAAKQGKLPKIVVPVHLCGQPADMDAIHALSRRFGFAVIEDASHAIGAEYQGHPVGDCRYSDITIFSFHPVKIITTGEGGMALTNDDALAGKMAMLRSHGITRDETEMDRPSDGPWYYEQQMLGFNYRITDIQAALGASQMKRLEVYVDRRRAVAARYDRLLGDLPITLPWQHGEGRSSWHLYVIRLQFGNLGRTHREVFEGLRRRGIGVNLHYIPVHTQPYYQQLGFKVGDFPHAERYYGEAISLPMFATLSTQDQDRVITALRAELCE